MRLRKAVLVALAAFVLLQPLSAAAQTPKGIGITPALQELSLKSNQASADFSFRLSNSTSEPVDLRLSLLDFGALDESGGVAFLGRTGQDATAYGLKKWMVLEKDHIKLEPGQSEEVKATVKNGKDLSPGGHYGAVMVSADNSNSPSTDSLALLPAASTLVLLKKIGGEQSKLELDRVQTNQSWFRIPESANLRFHNTGNIHLVPRGTVELFSPTGSKLSRGVINPKSSFILPDSFRQFEISIPSDKQPWLPGKYKLVTTWRYDGTEEQTVTEQQFFYIGTLTIWFLLGLLVATVLFLIVRYRLRPPVRGA